jgi:MoxR-like ATPase
MPPLATTSEQAERILAQVERAIVGKRQVLELVLLGILADGHVLLEDFPGLAKTLIARSFARAAHVEFTRVQFTPDLLPADITGTAIYNQRDAEFEFRPGPIFTNLLLADEVNRAPPKTQAALLEAMQERQVTSGRETRPLARPFVVIATQNPIEYEGTYPLPEAQLDRFLLKLVMRVPTREEEITVVERHHHGFDPTDLDGAGIQKVASAADLDAGRDQVLSVEVADEVMAYAVDLCRATRESPSLLLGVSPRGTTALLATSKAWAWLSGRDYLTPDDIKSLARPTLRHRVVVRPEAELEGVTADGILDSILTATPVPR